MKEIIEGNINATQDDQYQEDFIKWRDKYFEGSTKILRYKANGSNKRYSIEELHQKYTKAMLQSPFKSQTKTTTK